MKTKRRLKYHVVWEFRAVSWWGLNHNTYYSASTHHVWVMSMRMHCG